MLHEYVVTARYRGREALGMVCVGTFTLRSDAPLKTQAEVVDLWLSWYSDTYELFAITAWEEKT